MSGENIKLRPRLKMDDGDRVLVDTHSGAISTCNESAWVLLECMQAGATFNQLVSALISRFGVDKNDARHDARSFCSHLNALGLIDESA
jgi:hypothetical protein